MTLKAKYNNLGDFWKLPENEKPKVRSKAKRRRERKAGKRKLAKTKSDSVHFYSSEKWIRLRYRVIRKYKAICMACGRSKRNHGVTIHVDHIKPRSKYPHLALIFENLQILCEDCNLGKSNTDEIDWRADETGNSQ